ncbi:MAG: imidazolonepropionase [Bacteroidetes bacterium]|nr:MAG: imidazolonepropionase [Bacteroidota bacterium]
MQFIFPFSQILTMRHLSLKGALKDNQLEIINNGGILIDNQKIIAVDTYQNLLPKAKELNAEFVVLEQKFVLTAGLIDSHTHLCYAGSRAGDFAKRLDGKTYLDIAKEGGGILYSVEKTREATELSLKNSLIERAKRHFREGITTCEVKSGYGLNVEHELKMLSAIQNANAELSIDLISTCLAAHTIPKEFLGKSNEYLDLLCKDLLPVVKEKKLSHRIDIFVEDTAFTSTEAKKYIQFAQNLGFEITIHADQFHPEASVLAVEVGALSADHLEASTEKEIKILANSDTVATVLPGACLGLGIMMPPARKLLDFGACVAIATDWNPGSAPMGDLLAQTSILGTYQKLSMAELWAGITFRAAKALNINHIGKIDIGFQADLLAFPTDDFREILYAQGKLKPELIWKNGFLHTF